MSCCHKLIHDSNFQDSVEELIQTRKLSTNESDAPDLRFTTHRYAFKQLVLDIRLVNTDTALPLIICGADDSKVYTLV